MTVRRATTSSDGRSGTTLVEIAYRGILRLITDDSLVEGDRLPSEAHMASLFGVSRPVIRQALARLEQAGVVDVRWGAGSYILNAGVPESIDPRFGPVGSLNDLSLLFEVRTGIECAAAALAAERRPPAAIAKARRALTQMEKSEGNDAMFRDGDLDFHFAVAAASQNPLFERVLRSFKQQLEFSVSLVRTLSLTHPKERVLVVYAEHAAIIQAIESGDVEGARQAMYTHLTNACRRLFQGPADAGTLSQTTSAGTGTQ